MFLERMKTTDFDAYKKYVFVIPMGSTEQHGPFLPIGTDSYIQDELIKLTEASFPDVIFLPTLRVTCSEEHAGFFGTVWISTTTMESIIKETCESIKSYASDILFVTAHGGNRLTLKKFVDEHQQMYTDTRLAYVEINSEELEQKIEKALHGPCDAHAGNTEISMMLAINDALVSMPKSAYPKTVIHHPFQTNRLKDFSKDGIADNHPEWIVNKMLGRNVLEWSAEIIKEKLQQILKAS